MSKKNLKHWTYNFNTIKIITGYANNCPELYKLWHTAFYSYCFSVDDTPQPIRKDIYNTLTRKSYTQLHPVTRLYIKGYLMSSLILLLPS